MKTPPDSFSKADIKNRLLQKAADLWGYDESEMDGFDPLVTLLMEACAVEFEKIAREISGTQHRLVERLASLLNPDGIDAPRPAHAVAQARAQEPVTLLLPEAQFTHLRTTSGRQGAPRPVYFSPLLPTRLTDTAVRYLATDATLWQVETGVQKRTVVLAAPPKPAEHRRLWIGVEVSRALSTIGELVFYFDWPNEPQRELYQNYLPGQWFLGDHELRVTRGLGSTGPAEPTAAVLQEEYEYLPRLERQMRELYAAYFVRVEATPAARLATIDRRTYPHQFEQFFERSDLQTLTERLVWIEVRFSHALPPEALAHAVCALNCFPVLNRRLNRRVHRLQPALNIFPLDTEDSFLAMREVYSMSNVAFRSTTLTGLDEGATDTYTLRYQGVGRFDVRSAKEALLEVLDLLRDESRAFAAAGIDYVAQVLRELNQNLARLEERLAKRANAPGSGSVPYLVLRPQNPADSVCVEYWSTDGELSNNVASGSALQVHEGYYLDRALLLTTSTGGRERPRPEERVFSLRRNLLSRNRLVTMEDIKAACWAELGHRLTDVRVEKGFQTGAGPNAGFIRCIRVHLTPATPTRLTPEEWHRVAANLQTSLASQSAMNLPYEVRLVP